MRETENSAFNNHLCQGNPGEINTQVTTGMFVPLGEELDQTPNWLTKHHMDAEYGARGYRQYKLGTNAGYTLELAEISAKPADAAPVNTTVASYTDSEWNYVIITMTYTGQSHDPAWDRIRAALATFDTKTA